jgi:hypothetical protein
MEGVRKNKRTRSEMMVMQRFSTRRARMKDAVRGSLSGTDLPLVEGRGRDGLHLRCCHGRRGLRERRRRGGSGEEGGLVGGVAVGLGGVFSRSRGRGARFGGLGGSFGCHGSVLFEASTDGRKDVVGYPEMKCWSCVSLSDGPPCIHLEHRAAPSAYWEK